MKVNIKDELPTEINEELYKKHKERFFGTFGKEYAEKLLNSEKIINDFADNIVNNSKDLDPEIAAIVDEIFWDLVGDDNMDFKEE